MNSEQIKHIRKQIGLSQQAFAEVLGVSFATINRWENGKAVPQKGRVAQIQALLAKDREVTQELPGIKSSIPRLNFEGDPEAVKLVVEATRLQNGHLFNKAFGRDAPGFCAAWDCPSPSACYRAGPFLRAALWYGDRDHAGQACRNCLCLSWHSADILLA